MSSAPNGQIGIPCIPQISPCIEWPPLPPVTNEAVQVPLLSDCGSVVLTLLVIIFAIRNRRKV